MNKFDKQYISEDGVLTAGAVLTKDPSDVLLVTSEDKYSELLIGKGKENVLLLPPGHSRLLCLLQTPATLTGGSLRYRRLHRAFFAKFLAFLDEASAMQMTPQPLPEWIWLEVPIQAFDDKRHAEYWLLQHALDDASAVAPFLALLRHTEAYWLVRYLLEQSRSTANLAELGSRYGLSYSHFRRVCKEALGSNAKRELKNWRIARSLLELVEHRMNLTDIAMKHGYASSSHFSTAIKDTFGVSPRGLADITTLGE